MFQPYPLFMGLRYSTLRHQQHFIGFISKVSMVGIALSVMVLITVLSVMNGFPSEVRARLLKATPALTATQHGGISDWESVASKLSKDKALAHIAPFVEGQGMLLFQGQMKGVMTFGILPDKMHPILPLGQYLVAGHLQLEPHSFNVILGEGLAQNLGVHVGEEVVLVLPEAKATLGTMLPRLKTLHVVGIFKMNYMQDQGMAFLSLADAQRLYNLGDKVSGLQFALHNPEEAESLGRALQKQDPQRHYKDWTQFHQNYFDAVQLEKKMMFIILMLIVAMAVFNVLSTLVMVVTDKKADIAILRVMGASRRQIMTIFLTQGLWIGVVGAMLGMLGGIGLSLTIADIIAGIERMFHIQFLDESLYFIDRLPSELQLWDVLVVGGSAFLLSFLATIYPAYRASKLLPIEGLHYGT